MAVSLAFLTYISDGEHSQSGGSYAHHQGNKNLNLIIWFIERINFGQYLCKSIPRILAESLTDIETLL